MRKEITKIMGFGSQNTYYSWKKENRPIINFLETYFTQKDLEEFLEMGSVSKMETLNHYETSLNIEFNRFYRTKLDSNSNQYHIRFFWDFITRYKNEISDIEFFNCKSSINILLLDYHLQLIELCKNTYTNGVSYTTIEKFSDFITIIQELSIDLTYFIIKNVKSNFKPHINYLINEDLYPYAINILACATIDYTNDKAPTHREVRAKLFIRNFPTKLDKYGKDFYFVLESYLEKYQDVKDEIGKIIESDNDRVLF